MHGVFD